MNDDAEQQLSTASASYATAQLAKAFVTALTHADPETRARAENRGRSWRAVLSGMADGSLSVGSRTPVAGLPVWVTPEVVRGGFATGDACAGGPLQPYEIEAARVAGVPAERRALFQHCLTEAGLARLQALLDSGRYEVAVPEEAALLTVAWLVRAGEVSAAVQLVATIAPFADRLRFTPRPCDTPLPDNAAVHRRTVAEAGVSLARRRPNPAVEAQREALTVWQPFGDQLLDHWLETAGSGRVLEHAPGADWNRRGTQLLSNYAELAATYTRCTKHRKPKENLAILRVALEETIAGRPLDRRSLGLLRHAVESMVRRRGLPGSDRHRALRERQAAHAALPSHHTLAQLVLRRLSELPQDVGAADIAPLVAPVTEPEHRDTGLPTGAAVPAALRHIVGASTSAPIDVLVERGLIPSAEVLAELVPQLVAATTAQAYTDETLRTLMTVHYRAFRNRRSLLLLNLQRQTQYEELPWVRALTTQHRPESTAESAHAALRQLGELAVRGFPGTILPNPLIRELAMLVRQAELGAPLVEELAADIFMGTFTPKFLVAARVAGELLAGTLYERYYGIDYAAVRNLAVLEAGEGLLRSGGAHTSPGFARLCVARAGTKVNEWSVAANGKVIEQAQILTTHNLATLVHRVGVTPGPRWDDLARCAARTVCRLVARVHGNPRPLSTIKDAAYAWRQTVFYLSLCTPATQQAFLTWLDEETERQPAHAAARLAPVVAGLRLVADGGTFAAHDTAAIDTRNEVLPRQFMGWTTGRHWMRDEQAH
ncbi:hypothetical protein ACFW17_34615 [Streptomyces sp. NPDC058961]|uniref:hypothetical protein n=1 Tax=Streptomyces sp. NPDC058961 TaxID=3346680 RepID=UPI0036B84614